ncbi:MAG: selenocysteine lyase/cysteine desulfurase [Flavobacteriaceae bacterium]|jgi:selenocysteine lyase/cysteine desulfurase
MIECQKHLFSLSEDVTYLNCATMSAQLKSVEEIGIENLLKKSNPYLIKSNDFFDEREILKQRFAQLIEAPDPQSIAIIPSVSYGIAIVAKNIPFEKGDEVVLLGEQFPSNYYSWRQLEKEKGIIIKTVKAPSIAKGRGAKWNEAVLEAISSKTKMVSMPVVHWTDGTLFDIKAIRRRTNEVGSYLIIDGTQSIGAVPFSISEIQPDALICAGYKWLMGSYGLGLAYFGERFYNGSPLENNWISHEGSEDFSKLVNYNENFKPKSARYDMGESSNFVFTPMLSEAIRQLLIWTPKAIQEYCQNITKDVLPVLEKNGFFIEDANFRGHHLFGIYLPNDVSIELLKENISSKNIFVSFRGQAIRIAPNVYNSKEDIEKLVSCFI